MRSNKIQTEVLNQPCSLQVATGAWRQLAAGRHCSCCSRGCQALGAGRMSNATSDANVGRQQSTRRRHPVTPSHPLSRFQKNLKQLRRMSSNCARLKIRKQMRTGLDN